jgi:hypothetical protein
MQLNTALLDSYLDTSQMIKDNQARKKQGNQALLSSLTVEVDSMFFGLRKADQVIRRELILLNQDTLDPFKKSSINPIDLEKLITIFNKIPLQQLLVDEYITYMLRNEKNSIFKLIEEYNVCLDKRLIEQYDKINLKGIDEKLAYYIRHLGAMTYHLNIHLNLINVLLKNANRGVEPKQIAIEASKEIVMEYMVKEWGEQQRDVKFLEITIDEPYAIVTWVLEDLSGDAILFQDEGFWQLMNISASRFALEDFEKADVPLAVAQRMLELHHQKLGY